MEGIPARAMTDAEYEIRRDYDETFQRLALRIGALCCASVIIRTPEGDEGIGTAFHVGEGVYLTARHVVDGNEIRSIIPHNDGYLFRNELKVESGRPTLLNGEIDVWRLRHSDPKVEKGPLFHMEDGIDVAAVVVGGIDPNTPHMMLGHHYDDMLVDRDFLLTTGMVFGYPPVPMSKAATQIVASVEVNGVVDTTIDRYVRFIVSGPPRGGFSGGPVFHDYGFVLGIVTESLERSGSREPGFLTVQSVDAIHELLEHHNITPQHQMLPTKAELVKIARDELEERSVRRAVRSSNSEAKADRGQLG